MLPNQFFYLGKSNLEKGRLLGIPCHVRHMFNLAEGDALEMYTEGNQIIMRPTNGLSHIVSSNPVINDKENLAEDDQKEAHGQNKSSLKLIKE